MEGQGREVEKLCEIRDFVFAVRQSQGCTKCRGEGGGLVRVVLRVEWAEGRECRV